jgi:hypothetical protein
VDYRKPKQAMEARREKRRGIGRPRKTWEDCVIDVARRKRGQKGEKKRHRKTKEDLGGLCDRCGQEKTRP